MIGVYVFSELDPRYLRIRASIMECLNKLFVSDQLHFRA
jgi:hypothetical protein